MTILDLNAVSKSFGGLRAVESVSFKLKPGERRAIVGPNGAGKTTLFNLLGGQLLPSSGTIVLFGTDITRLPAHRRANLGLARTFQISNLFPSLSVEENIVLTLQAGLRRHFTMHRPAMSFSAVKRELARIVEEWSLAEQRSMPVRFLSYGAQRRLEIALALAMKPKLLLLDEPTAGLSPEETLLVTSLIGGLDRGVTVVLIEHDMDVAFQVADRFMVMHQGRVIADGTPEDVRNDRKVQEIYLGTDLAGEVAAATRIE